MFKIRIFGLLILSVTAACYNPPRNCKDFKEGEFSFTTTIGDNEQTTTFVRTVDTEIDFFEGKADTSSIRWINDCEYIVKKLNPQTTSEEKSIHMKILSTTDSSYTFEYGLVGSSNKSRGTAFKVN
ncbi:MAG: DNA topoisomerase IV [Eudoraea sp.]|nr:DNA topoisomerase IV [Eudoraea sp.]